MNATSQDQKQDKVSIILFNFVSEIVLRCNKARKSNKKQLNMKAISKTVFIHRKCNCLCRKSNLIYNKATRTNEFRELQNIRVMQKINCILYTKMKIQKLKFKIQYHL